MKNIIILAVMTLGFLTTASARPYGDAGCGLGSIVMGADGNQILAATLNATGYQTIGITFGTSNCAADHGSSSSNEEAQIRYFIEVNRISLASDISRGQGETIDHLSALLGCNSAKVGSTLKKNYEQIFKNDNLSTKEIESSIFNVLGVNKVSQGTCTNLG